ncbi:haloacid dehalogenase-like hydrolase domain-containing At3g48420 [Olea europaea subsp. europaea]|uniref:Haloacid dehalogenase-like hydrolase domain-containing At3g48420 n=1 Tax=Olea europaea subsp. europaea TaxID=158383 RepID=A0A8S0RFH9_OLEEU|nr:haloacid dehalogenase-like hydrolase domain-containing At3g48420 [Olea europaea subsp. europaea]
MLILYFDRIGWPTSVPTSEKGAFMKRVLREKKNALDDLVMSKAFPLRPGVEEFIDEASKDGVPVVFLTAYGSSGEKIARGEVKNRGLSPHEERGSPHSPSFILALLMREARLCAYVYLNGHYLVLF